MSILRTENRTRIVGLHENHTSCMVTFNWRTSIIGRWHFPSASEVTTIWRYTNVYIIIIIMSSLPETVRAATDQRSFKKNVKI